MTDIATLKIEVRADGTAKVVGDLTKLEKQSVKTEKSFSKMGTTAKKLAAGLGLAVGFSAITSTLVKATGAAGKFEKAMAEVSTLTNSMDMGQLTEQVKELSAQFGSDVNTQAKALYQIISAGASTAAEASDVLTAANKLAIGGVTDVATAADGLTSAMNAYGLAADQATDVSDMMFVAMKAGKTTIGELSANIGKLAPIAAQAGVGMDELLAATATITKTGLNTSMTMNSLRQAIAGILKPSQEASKAAAAMGLDFNAAALESRGLFGMLQDVQEATEGSTEKLTQLFPSVESLGAVMALVSETGAKDFEQILGDMAERAGATDEAFSKMSKTSAFLGDVLKTQLGIKLMDIGTVMLDYLNPALTYVVANFDELFETVVLLGQLLLTGALTKGLLMLPQLFMAVTTAVGGTIAALIKFSAVLLANPIGLIAVAVTAAVAALWVFRDSMVEIGGVTASVSEWVQAAWKVTSDKLLEIFDSLGGNLGTVWDSFGEETQMVLQGIHAQFSYVFGDLPNIVYDVVNNIIRSMDFMGKSVGMILAAMVTPGDQDVFGDIKLMWKDLSGKDYIGDFKKNTRAAVLEIKTLAKEQAATEKAARDLADQTGKTGEIIADTGASAEAAAAGLAVMGKTEKGLAEEADKTALALAKQKEELTAYIGELEFEISLLNKSELAQRLERLEREYGAVATEDQMETLQRLTKEMHENKTATEAATKAQAPFVKALEGTAGRIDAAFAQAWQGAFDSFDDFADGLIDAFKNLLAEMAHLAITRPIVVGITSGLTGGSAGAMAGEAAGSIAGAGGIWSSLTSAGGISSLFTSGLSAITAAGASMYQGMGHVATALGANGVAIDAYAKGLTTNWQSMGLDIGAGIIGAFLGNKAFGDTTGVGAGVGGAVGSIWGPVGAGVGSFLGTGAERLLGNMFGFGGKGGNNAARSDFNLGTGARSDYGVGKNFDQANLEGVTAITDQLEIIAALLGGSNFSGNIKLGNTSGLKMDGKAFKTQEEFFQYAIDQIVDSANNLSSELKTLIIDFDGTSEEILAFAAGMVMLTDMIKTNPVDQAVKDFAEAQEAAATTLTMSYEKQIGSVADLIFAYDGSANATAQLASEMGVARDLAYQMALAIKATGLAMNELLSGSAAAIREQMRSPEETRAFNISQRDIAREGLASATTTEEVAKYAAMFEQYNTLLFNSLTETQRNATTMIQDMEVTVGEAYALAAENQALMVDQRLNEIMKGVKETQDAINTGVADLLNNAAAANESAARTLVLGSNNFAKWVQVLITQGITVNLADAPQVNV